MLKRFRHSSPKYFLTRAEMDSLQERISQFESKTSCEIVFHFRKRLGPEALLANQGLFHKFKLHETKHHNGILITLALKERRLAIWSDEGVIRKVGDKLWDHVTSLMTMHLKKGENLKALLVALDEAQKVLETEQPHFDDQNANELSNRPIIEDEE